MTSTQGHQASILLHRPAPSAGTPRRGRAKNRAAAWLLAAAAIAGATAPVAAQTPVTLYRGVQADANTGQVLWTGASFGVSGTPPTLSFFDNQALLPGTPQCVLSFTVTGSNPVGPGSTGNLAVPMPPATRSPWVVAFDQPPAGHWSIAKTAMYPAPPPPLPSNNQASAHAAAVFRAMALAGTVTISNGSVLNCHP